MSLQLTLPRIIYFRKKTRINVKWKDNHSNTGLVNKRTCFHLLRFFPFSCRNIDPCYISFTGAMGTSSNPYLDMFTPASLIEKVYFGDLRSEIMRCSFRSKVSVSVHAEIIISCSLGSYHPQQSKFHYKSPSQINDQLIITSTLPHTQ